MKVLNILRIAIQYITEGFMEIFRSDEEQYPAIGVQPFGGTVRHHSRFDW